MPVMAEQLLLGFQSGELKPAEFVHLAEEVPIVELATLRDALLIYAHQSLQDQRNALTMARSGN
jgi:hypothetical protein